jgi:hypothetical protein
MHPREEGQSDYSSSSDDDKPSAKKPAQAPEVVPVETKAQPSPCEPSSKREMDDIEMPLTGTGYPMMYPPPHHIWVCPPYPEPLNEIKEGDQKGVISLMTTHDNKRTMSPASVLNRVVYDSIEPNPAWKSKKPLAPGEVRRYYDPSGPDDDTLIFESRFESGNLRRAIQIYPVGEVRLPAGYDAHIH